MPNLKRISGVGRQDAIKAGVDANQFARAQDVNPLIDLFNNLELKNFASDALAAAGGVKLFDLYHNAGVVQIRLV